MAGQPVIVEILRLADEILRFAQDDELGAVILSEAKDLIMTGPYRNFPPHLGRSTEKVFNKPVAEMPPIRHCSRLSPQV